MSYDVTLTGAYQSSMKAATDIVVALINQGANYSADEAAGVHGTITRSLFEGIKVVAGPEAQAAASRPQSSGGRSGGGSRGGGQSSIPTDGSTMFGQKQDDGTIKGGGAVAGLTIAQVAGLSGSQMQDRGIGDGSKTGLAYLKGLLEWEDFKNDYMKRRIKAYFDNLNQPAASQPDAGEQAPQGAPVPVEGTLDADFKFPED